MAMVDIRKVRMAMRQWIVHADARAAASRPKRNREYADGARRDDGDNHAPTRHACARAHDAR
jgi:hypothetical protein